MTTTIQKKKLAKIFRMTGKTFQEVVVEAGLQLIPDHIEDLPDDDARKILKHFGVYFIEPKGKQ